MKIIRYTIYIILGLVVLLLGLSHFMSWRMDAAYQNFLENGVSENIFTRGTIIENGIPREFIQGGNKNSKTVVIGVHGSPGSADNFGVYFESERLRDQMQIIAYDRPGFGTADNVQQLNRLEEEVAYLSILVEQVSADTVIFLGHSYGCPVVLKYLTMHDDRQYGAVLIGSSIDPKFEEKNTWRKVLDAKIIRWMAPSSLRRCNTEIIALEDELRTLENKIDSIKAPITFHNGALDKLVPLENIEYFKEHDRLPEQRRYRIEAESGHFIIWTKSEAVIDEIMKVANSLD